MEKAEFDYEYVWISLGGWVQYFYMFLSLSLSLSPMVGIDTLIHTPKVYENELPLFFTHPNNSFSLTQVMVHLSLSLSLSLFQHLPSTPQKKWLFG
jgi:hypothetical protein